MKSYETLIDKHEGETAFVVGAGTSLYGVDLSPIHDHVVISVNSSIILMPWQDGDIKNRYWISNDSAVRGWSYWEDVKKSKATKIIRNSWKKYYEEIPDFLVFSPRKEVSVNINLSEKALCYSSSIPSAIDLAIQMGCKNIFLLGVDHYFRNGRSHFWQLYNKECQPVPVKTVVPPFVLQQHMFNVNEHSYDLLKWFADFRKAKIYNCNPLSMVKPFDKIEYKNALEMVKEYGKV